MEFMTKRVKHSDEEGEGEEGNWSNLPQEIVESILKRLCLPDYLQFGAVCTSWQNIVANAIKTKHCPPAPQLPMLIVFKDGDTQIFSLETKKLIQLKTPLYNCRNQCCLGSIEGWLIMFGSTLLAGLGFSDPHSPFFFLNPVSGVRITLPSELSIPQHVDSQKPPFSKMVASSSPYCKDCFVVGLFPGHTHLAFCRLADKSWTIIEAEITNLVFWDLEIINSKLYVLVDHAGENLIKVYDLQNPNTPKVETLSIPACNGDTIERIMGNIKYVSDSREPYLAKDAVSGELLLVLKVENFAYDIRSIKVIRHRTIIKDYVIPPDTTGLRLWKYNCNDSQWVEVENLADC